MKFLDTTFNAMDIAWLAVIMLTVWIYALLARRKKPARTVRQKPGKLFTAEERRLFLVLESAFRNEYVVLGKIRAADVIAPMDASQDMADSPCIPFLLCRRSDLSVACILQWASRSESPRKKPGQRGSGLSAICQAAGLPLLSLQEGRHYDIAGIRALVGPVLEGELLFAPESAGRREPRISEVEKLQL